MKEDVNQYIETCFGYLAAVGTNTVLPMMWRSTLDGVWKECSVDFKGPIGGKYYLHMLQGNLSRWPKVEVVEITSFENLSPALERQFGA